MNIVLTRLLLKSLELLSRDDDKYVTRKLTLGLLVLVWVISAAVAAGPLVGWGRYGYDAKTHYCGYDRTASISYTILIAAGTIGAPAMAVCYFNYSIFSFVREARRTLNKWRKDANTEDEKKSSVDGSPPRLNNHVMQTCLAKAACRNKCREDEEMRTYLEEKSTNISSSTPETSISTGSDPQSRSAERPKRRKKQISSRSMSQRPGSLKLKRQKDRKSRQRAEPQKHSNSYIIFPRFRSRGSRAQFSPSITNSVDSKDSTRSPCALRTSSNERILELLPQGSASQLLPPAENLGTNGTITPMRQNCSQPLGIKNLDMIRTLFVVFVCMAVFMSPYMVTTMADVHDRWSALVHCACSYLAVVNNAINWMLYGMLNSSFRAGYRKVMLDLCARRGRVLQTTV
ncbi:hypothetical protein EGW08_007124 [Elysia chlorotica]|uniref:G-protein coupled receptors family 1 profile domain-containing protein n=1 Tax=Elysia chlorotica TaxID=188477 RepID=A0A433TUA2_ELYCH|nr:hypothetical protein EGW08_007124 [Elysia chlorotica]